MYYCLKYMIIIIIIIIIDEHIVNADLPRTMRYESIQDRIESLAESK